LVSPLGKKTKFSFFMICASLRVFLVLCSTFEFFFDIAKLMACHVFDTLLETTNPHNGTILSTLSINSSSFLFVPMEIYSLLINP